jgi:hypothetical protein
MQRLRESFLLVALNFAELHASFFFQICQLATTLSSLASPLAGLPKSELDVSVVSLKLSYSLYGMHGSQCNMMSALVDGVLNPLVNEFWQTCLSSSQILLLMKTTYNVVQ